MSQDRKYTAFCGLYCKDCIPSNSSFFRKIAELENFLEELNFERYAELKSKKYGQFKEYPKFVRVLKEIKKLECTMPCYEGPCSEAGCKPNCDIRSCNINKGYEGCWECPDYKNCNSLLPQKEVHPGLEQNLDIIRQYGLDKWSDKRGKHYKW